MEKSPVNTTNKTELPGVEQSVERFLLSEQEKNIQEVFKLNPELEQIGTVEQYTEYLKSIFPKSEVQDIVWHYSDNEFKDENFKPIKPNFDTLNSIEGIYNFSTNQKFVSRYGKNAYPVLLNIQKAYQTQASGEYVDDMDRPLSEALFKIGKQKEKNILAPQYDENLKDSDAVINTISGEDYVEKHPISGREIGIPGQKLIAVFNTNQIHILGSKTDIEKFKEFVSKNENKKENQSIEEFLKESGLEKVPHIETNFLFHRHATKEDGENVANKLDNSDILIHENAGWDKERLETWRKVASGEFTAEQALEHEKERGKEFWWNDYYKAIFEKLHGSNKDVLLVDVESDDEVFQEIYSILEGNSIYNNLVNRESSYQETLEQISNYSELESLLQKERENKILENMKTNLLQLLKEKPELQNKENLNILFPMGAFHTRLYHETKKRGDKVSQEFSASPYTFDSRSTIERKIHFLGIEKAQEDMPKVLLYWLLRKSGALSTNEVPHKFISKFSDEQIKELFNLYQKSKSDQEFKPEALNWITKYFRK